MFISISYLSVANSNFIVQETVRSILPLSDQQTNRVINSLWKEYSRRSTYTRYLIRARQKLLASIAHIKVSSSPSEFSSIKYCEFKPTNPIQHMSRADSRVRDTSRRHFYSVAASIFLKKRHESIR